MTVIRNAIIILFSATVLLLIALGSCNKPDNDYRTEFTGTYYCKLTRVDQHYIEFPDSIWYYYDTSYSENVALVVTPDGDPEKVVILDHALKVNEDGSLETWGIPYEGISGAFFPGDSIYIIHGVGKMDGYTEYWEGRK